jgi:hypothetical protein
MGRGLSDLQKGILGIAYTVNVHTQGGGEPRAKDPETSRGILDYRTPLGVCLLYGIVPSAKVIRIDPRWGEVIQSCGGYFAHSAQVHRAKVASSRAATNLHRRGLLIQPRRYSGGWGYVLTEPGIEVGRANLRDVPLIDETLAYFQIAAATDTWRTRCPSFNRADYIAALASWLAKTRIG